MQKKLVLIDGNALVHRAFHALPPNMKSPKGVLTNAVYGFSSILFKMIKELKPDYIAATFDLAGPTFRHEEFEDYKAHREKAPDELYAQFPLVKSILKLLGIPIFEKEGFEADDLIGTLSQKGSQEKNLQVIIATGDLDTLQLVEGSNVVVFTLRKGITDTITYNEKAVKERYGITPEQVTDFKGLKGDPSDNIPGVPGVGDKTASILIQKFNSLEELYNQLEKNPDKTDLSSKLIEKLIENKDQAFFSKKLATIIRDVDIDYNLEDTDWRANLDRLNLERVLKELGFSSLINRLSELGLEEEQPNQSLFDNGGTSNPESIIRVLKTKQDIKNSLDDVESVGLLAIDINEGLFNFTLDGKSCFSFDLNDIRESKAGPEIWKKFINIAQNEKIIKIGHNFKELVKLYTEKEINLNGIYFDTELASYLLDADAKDYSLENIYFKEFSESISDDSRERPLYIWKLRNILEVSLKDNDLWDLFNDIEMPLIKVLADMELNGVKIDTDALKALSKSVNKDLISLEKKIYKMAGTDFNINSSQQLKEILFERLNLKGKVRKTKGGALSTAASELEKLSDENPIIGLILKYRELRKLKTTYIEPFPELVDKKTSRIYATFNQTGTATGRLSSQDPNLQNIPIKSDLGMEFRKSFIAGKGYDLLSIDYSQLDLRIVAHISKDEKMINAFQRGEDIHTRTASEIFKLAPDKVTKDMRRTAKVLNFGIIYGMGIIGFQRASGVTRERAREFIDKYMEEFSGVAKYMDDMRKKAHRDGFVSTIFGRRRMLPDIKTSMPQLVSQAERIAINMPIQGTASDIMKMAMIDIYDLIQEKYGNKEVRLLIQVHDELLFEVKSSLIKEVSIEFKKLMEEAYKLLVPLTADVKIGNNWRDMS